jgi:hypothetical protein
LAGITINSRSCMLNHTWDYGMDQLYLRTAQHVRRLCRCASGDPSTVSSCCLSCCPTQLLSVEHLPKQGKCPLREETGLLNVVAAFDAAWCCRGKVVQFSSMLAVAQRWASRTLGSAQWHNDRDC